MPAPKLTSTSYLVLGLVARSEPVTSYDMKQLVRGGIGRFWTFPHSQLYAEPERLVGLGLLTCNQEETGRRRRTYRITPNGKVALDLWLKEPAGQGAEIRDPALLKLVFCSLTSPMDLQRLAGVEAGLHQARLREWQASKDNMEGQVDPCQLAALDLGIRYAQVAAEFWREVAENPPSGARDTGVAES